MFECQPTQKSSVVTQIFGDQGFAFFWEARFLPSWLPLLLSVGQGFALAVLIVNQTWYLALALALAIPVVILFLKYPFAGVLIWLLVFPFFLEFPSSIGTLTFWMLHRAMVPAALGIAILSGWLGIKRGRVVRLSPAEWSMALFVGLLLANILLYNESPLRTIIQAYDEVVVPFCMYWLIRAVAPGERDMKRLLAVALVTLVAQSAIGLTSWYAPQVLPSHWRGLEGARTVGTLRNTAVFSSVLLFSGVLLLQSAVRSRSSVRRLGLIALFVLALYSVYMTFSRGSWLGALLVIVGLIFVYPKVMIRLLLFLAIIVAVLGGTLFSDQLSLGYERIAGLEARNSAESRVTSNDASITMTSLRPVLGWGYDNYDEARRPFLRRVGGVPVHEATSHNTYLTIAAELGLIALFLYMLPLFWWLYWSVKARRRFPRQGFLSWPVLLSLWLVMLHMFVVTNFMDMIRYFPFGTTIWWMVLGLIANIVDTQRHPGNLEAPEQAQAAAGSV